MAKPLFFLLVALVIYLVVRIRRAGRKRDIGQNKPVAIEEEIVACSRCGVHVPLSESVEVDGRRYCCEEHGHLD